MNHTNISVHISSNAVLNEFLEKVVLEGDSLNSNIPHSLIFNNHILVVGIEQDGHFPFLTVFDRNELNPLNIFESLIFSEVDPEPLLRIALSEMLINKEKLMIQSYSPNFDCKRLGSVKDTSNYNYNLVSTNIGREPTFCFLPYILLTKNSQLVVSTLKETEEYAHPYIGYPPIESKYFEELGLPLRSCPRFSEFGNARIKDYAIDDLYVEEVALKGLKLTSAADLSVHGLSIGQEIEVSYENSTDFYENIVCRIVQVSQNKIMARALEIPKNLETRLIRRENRVNRIML